MGEKLGSVECLPQVGKVGFGSGLHAWGFTLKDFAKMYSSKFGLSEEKMMKKLWGENYWNPKEKKWIKKNTTGKLERGFEQFVLKPIKILFDTIMSEQKDVYEPIIEALQLKFTKKDLDKAATRNKDYLKLVMRTWIPAGNALLDMIAEHLPSPATAQAYRCENLYSGPLDSEEANAVRTCDSKGPMSMYISKLVPTAEKGRFIAFGRVFSGTIKTGQEIRIMGPDFVMGKKKDLFIKKVQRTLLMMGRYVEQIADCPAGNVCGIGGIDQFLLKSGTLTTSTTMHPFHTMKFSVAAVVNVAVEPKNAQSGVFNTLNTRRGEIDKIEERIGTPLSQVQAFLPVIESFGFTELLRKNTGGQAFPQMKFSHWKIVSGDVYSEGTPAHEHWLNIRKRKGMKEKLPLFGDYYDKV